MFSSFQDSGSLLRLGGTLCVNMVETRKHKSQVNSGGSVQKTQVGNSEHIPKLSNSSVTKSHTPFLDPDQGTQAKYSFTSKSGNLARVLAGFQ